MSRDEVALVLLAAGLSQRFGSAKQLHPIDGRPLGRLQAEKALASRADRVIVVEGAYREEVRAALAGLALEEVFNPDFASGQSSSVRRGLAAARQHGAAAVLFLPVDLPFLAVASLDRLILAWQEAAADARPAAVVPTYGGERGAPVLFDQRLFDPLAALDGDQGGRVLLPRYPREIREVVIADPLEGRDLDVREDLSDLLPTPPSESGPNRRKL